MTDKPTILITGSSGLIGRRLVAALSSRFRIFGLDINEPEDSPPTVEGLQCDLTSNESVERALNEVLLRNGQQLASVVHLAAYYDFSGAPSDMYEKLTIEGTRRLVRNLQAFDVQQLIFSSTMLVMRPSDDGQVITEDSPLQGEWDYPKSKIATERLLAEEHGSIPTVIFRLSGLYDEYGHSPPIVHQIQRIYEKKLESHFFPGKADRGQPFMHINDGAAAFAAAINRREALSPFETFLLAEPELMTYGQLQSRIGELLYGREWKTVRIPPTVAKAGAWLKDKLTSEDQFIKPWMVDMADAHYPIDISRAQTELSWAPRHRLYNKLEPMIDSLLSDPENWYEMNGLS